MRTMTSVLAALILLTLGGPAAASERETGAVSSSGKAEIQAQWANRARDARREQVLQGLAVVGGSVAGTLLVGRALDVGSGPTLTPWALAAGVGAGAWLAADVFSWRTARGRTTAAPTRGGMRAALSVCW